MLVILILFAVAMFSVGCSPKKRSLGKIVAHSEACSTIRKCKELAEADCNSRYEIHSYYHKNNEYHMVYSCTP